MTLTAKQLACEHIFPPLGQAQICVKCGAAKADVTAPSPAPPTPPAPAPAAVEITAVMVASAALALFDSRMAKLPPGALTSEVETTIMQECQADAALALSVGLSGHAPA